MGTATAVALAFVGGTSNIDPDNKFAWGENAGWLNWRDANADDDGVVVAADHLAGFIWGENTGWIDVGDGNAPYANMTTPTSASTSRETAISTALAGERTSAG